MTDSKPNKPPSAAPMASTPGAALTTSNTTRNGALQKGGSGLKLPGLHARLRNPKTDLGVADPLKCTNRLALMLDVSGSMDGSKIESLRQAVTGFVSACDFSDTSLAYEPFGDDYPSTNRLSLTSVQPMLMTTAMMLQSCGSTPMARAMDYVINTYSITRAVLVSDGEPDSTQACYDSAAQFREAGIMIDCVHIGNSTSGEACLRRIAEITGGQYIKFTDVTSFSKSFKYLTPKFYAMLTSGGVTAADLGAKELK
jgi:Mg-chelatase subunit ChlD